MDKIDYENLNKEDFIKEQEYRDKIFQNISRSIHSKDFESDDVQNEISNLFNWMNKFYDCSINMFHGLAEVYEFNPSFSEILIKNYGQDMPGYLSKAIVYFCDNRQEDDV